MSKEEVGDILYQRKSKQRNSENVEKVKQRKRRNRETAKPRRSEDEKFNRIDEYQLTPVHGSCRSCED